MGAPDTLTPIRYPRIPDGDSDLDGVIDRLEAAWTAPINSVTPTEWPVEVAAKVCPVFRYLTGGGR